MEVYGHCRVKVHNGEHVREARQQEGPASGLERMSLASC